MISRDGITPRVRGRAIVVMGDYRHHGITPVCAGKGPEQIAKQRVERDHPRVCGEGAPHLGSDRRARGSPPRRAPAHGGARLTVDGEKTPGGLVGVTGRAVPLTPGLWLVPGSQEILRETT